MDLSKEVRSQSKIAESTAFKEFITSYYSEGPSSAYEKLKQMGSSKETLNVADHFLQRAYQVNEDTIKQNLTMENYKFSKIQEKVMVEFCQEFLINKDYQGALRNAQYKISKDAILAKDTAFQEYFNSFAKKIKPGMVENTTVDIAPQEGLLFAIRAGKGKPVELPKKNKFVKKLISDAMLQIQNHGCTPQETVTMDQVNADVNALFYDRKPSLATRIALQDAGLISDLAAKALKETNDHLHVIRLMRETGQVFKFTDKNLFEGVENMLSRFEKAPSLSKTERVDIFRDLIMDLGENIKMTGTQNAAFTNAFTKLEKIESTILERAKQLPEKEREALLEKSLSGVLKKHMHLIQANPIPKQLTQMMLDVYGHVLKGNLPTKSEEKGIAREVRNLLQGVKSASVIEGIREIAKKRETMLTAMGYDKVLCHAIKNPSKDKNITPDITELDKIYEADKNQDLAAELNAPTSFAQSDFNSEEKRKGPSLGLN